ncbi:hypothetical protein T484DRAFT_1817703, partial [Baffinella frigidus]
MRHAYKMEDLTLGEGAHAEWGFRSMRHAYKMEDLTLGEGAHTEFVAKMSKNPNEARQGVSLVGYSRSARMEVVAKMSKNPNEARQVYFDDVQMQMEAKGWADRFNARFGRK